MITVLSVSARLKPILCWKISFPLISTKNSTLITSKFSNVILVQGNLIFWSIKRFGNSWWKLKLWNLSLMPTSFLWVKLILNLYLWRTWPNRKSTKRLFLIKIKNVLLLKISQQSYKNWLFTAKFVGLPKYMSIIRLVICTSVNPAWIRDVETAWRRRLWQLSAYADD